MIDRDRRAVAEVLDCGPARTEITITRIATSFTRYDPTTSWTNHRRSGLDVSPPISGRWDAD
jgi:hypothetical protein